MNCCHANGISIPETCSVIGFGNTSVAEDLALTSISQHSDKIASAIVRNLRLSGATPVQTTVIPAPLMLRSSTASPCGPRA